MTPRSNLAKFGAQGGNMQNKKLVKDFLYENESYAIVSAAREVWQELGGGFKEKIADKAFSLALRKRGFKVEDQKKINVFLIII